MNGVLAPASLRQWPSEGGYMPLLRSLANRAARGAINMALLTELFASLLPPLRLVKDGCTAQRGLAHSKSWRQFGWSMAYFGLAAARYFAGSASNSCLQLSLQKK